MAIKKRTSETSLFRMFYILVVAALLVVVLLQEWKIYQVRSATKEAEQRIEELQKKQAELKEEIVNLQDPAYIERVARREYKMIKVDEIPIVINEKK